MKHFKFNIGIRQGSREIVTCLLLNRECIKFPDAIEETKITIKKNWKYAHLFWSENKNTKHYKILQSIMKEMKT